MKQIWIPGIHSVLAVLERGGNAVDELWLQEGSRNPRLEQIQVRARELGVSVHRHCREELDARAEGVRHQGVMALYRPLPPCSEADLETLLDEAGTDALLLVLDGVTDPHNFGACLRSAAAANLTAVIVPKDRAVGLTPIVRRAAAGGAEQVPVVTVTNLARTLRKLKDQGVWLVGLSGDTEKNIYSLDLRGSLALVLGAEGEGMRRLTAETCDYLVRIPMPGQMESLNVSVATGVALFEALRQRGGKA